MAEQTLDDLHEDVEYWSNRLKEIAHRAAPHQRHIHLTFKYLNPIEVMRLMEEYAAVAANLATTVKQIDALKKRKKTFWQKLFRK